MEALVQLRNAPGVLGVALRSGRIRLYSASPDRLLAQWQERWPFTRPQITAVTRGPTPDMEDVFKAYSQAIRISSSSARSWHELRGEHSFHRQRGEKGIPPHRSRLASAHSDPFATARVYSSSSVTRLRLPR
jgi:hypothetical protein